MAYSTVVFDLDGTLLDTATDLVACVNHALGQHGLPARSDAEVIAFTGNGIARLIEQSVPTGTDAALASAVFEDFRAYYGAHALDHTAPYPGVPELLANLRAAGVACSVVSNKADFAVQKIIEAKMSGCFDAVLGEREQEGIRKKPAPDMVEAALAQMGRGHESLAYVGDSEVDIATAAAVGCSCISCTWGFRGREWLVAHGATTLVDTPDELQRILLAR